MDAADPTTGDASPALAALVEENARLREDLASVLQSSSWRITRPLRRLRSSTRPEGLPAPAPAVDLPLPVPEVPAPPVERDPAEPGPGVPVRFMPGHYYSSMPDARELLAEPRRSQVWATPPRATPGVDWREAEQIRLCNDVFSQQARLEFGADPTADPNEYYSENGQYPSLDAWLLEAVLRWQRPRRMIEIGSGFSSLVTARVNRELLDGSVRFTCIEPYPRPFLLEGVPGISDLIVEKIQDVPVEEFESLGAGDILFVDTSHTVKTGGDVTWIFHEIIPRLAPGVVVHVHDAFLPGDYPEQWVREGWGWNEAYLLHSFLTFNSAFEVVIGARYMAELHGDVLAKAFPLWRSAPDQGGAALWLRRRA